MCVSVENCQRIGLIYMARTVLLVMIWDEIPKTPTSQTEKKEYR